MIQLHEIVEEISEVVLFILHKYLFYEMRSSLGKKVNVGHGEAGDVFPWPFAPQELNTYLYIYEEEGLGMYFLYIDMQ